MPKITSVDALINRIKEAYPKRVRFDQYREWMLQGNYALVYEVINKPHVRDVAFDATRILEIIDAEGHVIERSLASLIEEAKDWQRDMELVPLRVQLEADFLESYDFEPAH